MILSLLELFQPTVDNQHDLKVVWIDDMLDDDYSGVRLAAINNGLYSHGGH